jgi:hypothetical protein
MFDKAAAVFHAALAAAAPNGARPVDVLRDSVGLEVVSFCQTWMRGDRKKSQSVKSRVNYAEFSVMSPHFQNRVS